MSIKRTAVRQGSASVFFMAQLLEMLAAVSPSITTEAPLEHVNWCYFLGCWLSPKLKGNSSN